MWKLCVIIVVMVLVLLPATPLLAASVDITVTATPYVSGGITGFTITYVSDYQLDFDWGYDGDATHIMIRGKYGDYPDGIPDKDTEPSDGWLVYYGTGTEATDWVNMEFLSVPIYYSAWAQKDNGDWYTDQHSGWAEGVTIMLFALMFLTLVLLVIAFIWKRGVLFLGDMIAWFILGGWSYTRRVTDYDIYFALFLLCMAFGIVSLYEAFSMRVRKVDTGQDEEDLNEDMSDIYETRREIEKTNQRNSKLYQGRQGGGGNRPPRRLSF